MQEVSTIPENFITVFNTMAADLSLPVPWPKPDDYVPPRAEDPILIWGAASSVGQFALQILKFYGYKKLYATASPKHHDYLKSLGAVGIFDYNDPNVTTSLLKSIAKTRTEITPTIPLIIDCIGSQSGTLKPISKLAENGTTVAVMLPVILKHASKDEVPEYSMDVSTSADWADGVNARGVRTHFVYEVSIDEAAAPRHE